MYDTNMKDFGWAEFLTEERSDVKRLDYVVRFSSIPSSHRETVSQHSFWVMFYSNLIHNRLCSGSSAQLDRIELLLFRRAMTHDIGECVTGDVVRTFKYSDPDLKSAINKAETNLVVKCLPRSVIEIINKSAECNESDSGYIDAVVKAADFVSLYHFMNREHQRGNKEITPFMQRMVSDLNGMADKCQVSVEWYNIELSDLYRKMAKMAFYEDQVRDV